MVGGNEEILASGQTLLPEVVTRGVAEIIDEREFHHLLSKERPLRLKMGFDPSAPDIHFGHVVGLRKLRQFQDLGHQVILIVGDWTAQIGDPSGQSITRPMLTRDQVEANAQTYLRQFFKVVDAARTEIVWQSEWFREFTLGDVITLTSKFTVAQFLQREDFRTRWTANRPIAITELLYPLLQAYDSVSVRSDVEFGGTDQKFNLLVGRELQQMMGQRPQQCFLVPILVGTDGVHKMSKSLGNYIAVDDPPDDQYGKVMSLPDELIMTYFELLTDVPSRELGEIQAELACGANPMVAKKQLAREVTGIFWGKSEALGAEERFQNVFQKREVPDNVPEYDLSQIRGGRLSSTLVGSGMVSSVSEARRLLAQRAVEIDGEVIMADDQNIDLKAGMLIRVGKRRFLRLTDTR